MRTSHLGRVLFSVMTLSRPASSLFWFVWHSLATIALILIASQLSVILNLNADIGKFTAVGMAAAYCASVIVLTFYIPKEGKIRLIELIFIFFSVFGSFFLFLLLTNSVFSRSVLIISLLVVSAFTVLSLSLKTALQKPALYIVSTLIFLVFLAGLSNRMRPEQLAVSVVKNKLIRTSFYNLIARHYNFVIEEATGGAISTFGERYLLATGDGQLHLLSWNPETKKLDNRKLALRVPLNRDEFVRDAAKSPLEVSTGAFRTADILVQDFGDEVRLFASHHNWNSEKQCFTVRVSAISGRYSDFVGSEKFQTWQTVYESTPCLAFKNKGDPFHGLQVGGKMALLDDHRLLVTIGDHEFDGVYGSEMLPQDKTVSYGKNILIDLDTHAASTYSMGHRNPQGLDVDSSGNIWSTDHGPKGGDELNLILNGKNYGWPLVTYGTDYNGQRIWPLNAKQNRHEGFELPVYAWIPSIGISAVVHLQGSLFKIWKDDLLVSSLGDKSIWRVRVDKGRTIFAERIEIGERIRDFMEDGNGRLVLWTEASIKAPTQTKIVVVEPAGDNYKDLEGLNSVERGELLFARCDGCHRQGRGYDHAIGPDLQGIFQRRVAAAKGYNYSEALKSVSGSWTEKNLDAFLTDPQSFTPGTSMQVGAVPDPTERGYLIEYLKSRK